MTKKNGKQDTTAMQDVMIKDMPDSKKAHAKLLGERIRSAREQLGILDFEAAKIEAAKAQIRSTLQRDMGEADALVSAIAQECGQDLATPGLRFDLITGEFTKS